MTSTTRTTITTPRATTTTTSSTDRARRVAVLAIGNELLSGKIRDVNLHYLAGELRGLGLDLVLAMLVPDTVEAIVDALAYARSHADLILTSGGVGPTHDDITLAAVGAAFGRPLQAEPSLVAAIRDHYGERVNDDLLSMAQVPEGAELIQPAPFFLPIFRLEQVHVFPGDPAALRYLFEAWKETLRSSPFHLVRLELDLDEGAIAPHLRALEEAHAAAGLVIGSYPRFDAGAPYRVLVTLEAKDHDLVRGAADALRQTITDTFGGAALLRAEPSFPAD